MFLVSAVSEFFCCLGERVFGFCSSIEDGLWTASRHVRAGLQQHSGRVLIPQHTGHRAEVSVPVSHPAGRHAPDNSEAAGQLGSWEHSRAKEAVSTVSTKPRRGPRPVCPGMNSMKTGKNRALLNVCACALNPNSSLLPQIIHVSLAGCLCRVHSSTSREFKLHLACQLHCGRCPGYHVPRHLWGQPGAQPNGPRCNMLRKWHLERQWGLQDSG